MNTKERVFEIIESISYNEDAFNEESSFVYDLGMDSIDVANLVGKVEDEFKVFITDDECDNIKIVRDVITLVESKLNEQ